MNEIVVATYKEQTKEERRENYACGSGFSTLADVQDWVDWAALLQVQPCPESVASFSIRADLNAKIGIFSGDMTNLEVDAVVNAAKETCLGKNKVVGGVDGAIHKAAGMRIGRACELLRGVETGSAKATYGFDLPAPLIIHAVGPRGLQPDVLSQTYRAALRVAKKAGVKSVAFCCISTGIFKFPKEEAALVACTAIRRFLEEELDFAANMDKIVMCLFKDKEHEKAYAKALPKTFPIHFAVQ